MVEKQSRAAGVAEEPALLLRFLYSRFPPTDFSLSGLRCHFIRTTASPAAGKISGTWKTRKLRFPDGVTLESPQQYRLEADDKLILFGTLGNLRKISRYL